MPRAKTVLLAGGSIVVAILGWHLTQIPEAKRRAAADHSPHMEIEINPLTNVARLIVGGSRPAKAGQPDWAAALGQTLVAGIGKLALPTIEREMNISARESFDLYAMLLPYRVRIEVGATD